MQRPRTDEPVTPPPRVVIENIRPAVDCGRFPAKRVVGEEVVVRAAVFADGHDRIAAVVRFREREYGARASDAGWRELPMAPLGNDEWEARFRIDRLAVYEFAVQGWIDGFATWRDALSKKFAAGQSVDLELREGAAMLRNAVGRLPVARSRPRHRHRTRGAGMGETQSVHDSVALADDAGLELSPDRERLEELAQELETGTDLAARVNAALSPELAMLMRRRDARRMAATSDPPLVVQVDRERARTGAWYEMFPRSYSPDPGRSATFDEAARELPGIAAMNFDVVYLPPIHPIGRTFRKGRNNSLQPEPSDPGSPWAIGGPEGGHTAVEPGLGTIEDFERFVEVARRLDLEIALDLAYQASPDHPYVSEHPEWFRHRIDGSVRYAENPPKKYQDIYPFDFESRDWQPLWHELKHIVAFWAERGVRIFRVDNPHTKPFAFWAWLIAEVRREHPDVIFLAEAFTRPMVMRQLAKIGFSQSYSYFTWKNSKAEITDYFTELTRTEVREYMRPNLFANTPDILHEYLQRGGPPAFRARLLLAATLGASYGIYSGFELCENQPLREGSEEYFGSEKYQFRNRDFGAPGHLRELIARVNGIRRSHPALQSDRSLQFHPTDNDQLICYSKQSSDGRDTVLVVVNLDPVYMQHGWVRVPVDAWSLPRATSYEVRDLLSSDAYYWHDEWNYVRLDPTVAAGHVLHVPAASGGQA